MDEQAPWDHYYAQFGVGRQYDMSTLLAISPAAPLLAQQVPFVPLDDSPLYYTCIQGIGVYDRSLDSAGVRPISSQLHEAAAWEGTSSGTNNVTLSGSFCNSYSSNANALAVCTASDYSSCSFDTDAAQHAAVADCEAGAYAGSCNVDDPASEGFWTVNPSTAAPLPPWLMAAALQAVLQAAGNTTTNSSSSNSNSNWVIGTATQDQVDPVRNPAAADAVTALGKQGAAAAATDITDPLVHAAQDMVVAAVAAAPAGTHAPVADTHTLLNSGAMLLLGQGSTTIHGTNTGVPAVDATELCSPAACTSGNSCKPEDIPIVAAAANASSSSLHPRADAHREVASSSMACSSSSLIRNGRMRGRGLLVDCPLQLLVGESDEQEQQQQIHEADRSSEEASQEGICTSNESLAAASSVALTSGDVLVLGQSTMLPPTLTSPAAPATTEPAHSDSNAAGYQVGDLPHHQQQLKHQHQQLHRQKKLQQQQDPPAPPAPPVLQLLSCSSLLGSLAMTGSDNSLTGSGLALSSLCLNSAYLRFSSISTNGGSFTAGSNPLGGLSGLRASSSGRRASSFTARRAGSFTAQRAGSSSAPRASSFTGQRSSHPGALRAGVFSSQVPPGPTSSMETAQRRSSFDASSLASSTLVPGLGLPSASRPSRLPQLQESCSWGNNLNEADSPLLRQVRAKQQLQVPDMPVAQPMVPIHATETEQPQQQLIYLLD